MKRQFLLCIVLMLLGALQPLRARDKDKVHEIGTVGLNITGELGKVSAVTYQVKLEAGKAYVIDMVSPDQQALDPFLRLLDAKGKQLAEDDDGGEGLNAQIIFKVENTEAYQIVATCFGKGRGAFTLTVRKARAGEKALTKEEQAKLGKARQLNTQVITLLGAGKIVEAMKAAEEALALNKDVLGERHLDYARSLHNVGLLYKALGNYAKAEPLYRRSLDILKETLGEKHADYATVLNNLGSLYQVQGDHANAEPLYRKALETRKEVLGTKNSDYAASVNNLALVYYAQANYAKAEPLLREALAIHKETLGEKHPDYAASLNNLAELYRVRGNFTRTEPLLRQARDIYQEVLGVKHPDYAQSLNNLALLYESQGDFEKAEPLYRSARDINKEAQGEKHPDHATSLNNLAGLYKAQGRFADAEPLYVQALGIRKEVLGERHPDYALSLSNLAVLHSTRANDTKAEPIFRQAIAASQMTAKPVAFERLQTTDLRFHPNTVLCLNNYAELLKRSAGKNADAERYRLCDRTFSLALDVLDRVRQKNLDHPESRIQFSGDRFERLFPERIKVLQKLYDLEGKLVDLESAVATAEQGTARVFLDSLGESRANLLAGVSLALRTQEKELLRDIHLLDVRIETESAKTLDQLRPDLIGQLHHERRRADEKLKQLITQMEKEHPQYAGLKYPRPCTLQEARRCLAADEVALLFVPGKTATYLVLVEAEPAKGDKANGLAIIELAAEATLRDLVDGLIDSETLSLPARARLLGRQTFDALLGPCQERIKGKGLVIVPNGSLCFLPFELLVAADGTYLVEKHRIRYAPSLTALHLINLWKQKRAQPETPLFAVGDPVYGDAFQRLEHSGYEVAEIAKRLGAREEFVLTRHKASKSAVKKSSAANAMAKARYVHFATHGILGLDHGKQPALVLNQTSKDVEESFLQMDEISGLKLNADLVVLSACKSGQGRLHQGEGVTGLARAFLYAGSKGVVCSLWSVDDRETANLMVDFYTHLQKGRSAQEALRESQLAMIQAGKAPRYWAPFILIGE